MGKEQHPDRRRVLQYLAATTAYLTLAGCKSLTDEQARKLPTFPYPKPTPQPTKEETPTPLPTPEIIRTEIPGIVFGKYPADYEEITSQVTLRQKIELQNWLAQDKSQKKHYPDQPLSWLYFNWFESENYFLGEGKFKDEPNYKWFLFQKDSRQFYLARSDNPANNFVSSDDGAKQNSVLYEVYPIILTDDGKIISAVSVWSTNTKLYHALCIDDYPNQTKTLIKNEKHSYLPCWTMTKNAQTILFSFYGDKAPEKPGTFLVEFPSGKTLFHDARTSCSIFLNEDGSAFYFLPSGSNKGEIIFWQENKTVLIPWTTDLTAYEHVASPNLQFIARKLGMFPSGRTEAGQWGIQVYSPNGFFRIFSPHPGKSGRKRWSFEPLGISNDGTLETFGHTHIFKFENGTYTYSEGPAKPEEVVILKLDKK